MSSPANPFALLVEKDIGDEIASLHQYYRFATDEEETLNFIQNHRLAGVLLSATREIKRIFGTEISLELDLHHDPEEGWEELFIVIKTPYPTKRARELMNKLSEEWFLNIIDKVGNKLCITEEPL